MDRRIAWAQEVAPVMALAYHILAHKQPAQVARLVRALYHPDDVFVVHLDRSASRELHAMGIELQRAYPGQVHLQPPRAVLWGGPEIFNLQIEAMDIALRQSRPWHHFINLSGQDFPLGTRSRRLATLGPSEGTSFLTWFSPMETDHWKDARQRVELWYFHSVWINRGLAVPGIGRRVRSLLGWKNRLPYLYLYRRRRPKSFHYFGGSNHVVLARAACEYLAQDPQAKIIRKWLQHAGIGDEIVFQSILKSSPLAATLVNKNWREIDFEPPLPHPRVFRSSDFDRLASSENLFARKFDESVDASILDLLERRIQNGP